MRGRVCFFLFVSWMAVFITTQGWGQVTPSEPTHLVESLNIQSSLHFCGEIVPLDNREVLERFEKEMLIALWDRPQVILWIKRSNRYFPIIEEMLADAHMPDDLKYIVLIESALRPHIGSPKGALGFWQFTEGTGRKYGLRIDDAIDERRCIFASTRAAIACLTEFHEHFSSWTCAAAAFNMGKQGLKTEILVQKTDDYYHLYLPLETQRYVLRIVAAKLIVTNPGTYGFHLREAELYPPHRSDRVTVECPDGLPITVVAEAAKTTFKIIKDLNPAVRGYYLNEGRYTLFIPAGTAPEFQSRYATVLQEWTIKKDEYIYVVKRGDNLSLIADRFGVPLPTLFLWNDLKRGEPIHPGDRLIIYPASERTTEDRAGPLPSDNH